MLHFPHRYYEVLSPDQVRLIHLHAIRVLEEVGVWMPHQEVLQYFHDAGARVDFPTQRVWIPAHLVENSIRKFPSRFTWHARNPKYSLDMSGLETHFSFPDSAIRIITPGGERRPGTAKDGEDICRLCDALPNLAIASTGVNPPDMPSGVLEAWMTKTMYTCTSKPVFGMCRNSKISLMILRMAEVVADTCDHLPPGQLPIAIIMNPVSPLFNTPDQLDGLMVYLHRGLPVSISPEVQAGATGPATIAGVLVQQTAEFLAHATLAQLVSPGTPVIYGTVSSIFDMKHMTLAYGAPEADIIGIATVQIARYYGIPARMTGSSSDANYLGMQAGIESLMSTMLPLMAGCSFVLHGAGELENTMAVSIEKILIDEEIIGMARRLVREIDCSWDALGFDVINEVGPRGHFLGTEHTMRHFRREQFLPRLMLREAYDEWEQKGRKTVEERARDLAQEILAKHQPDSLPPEAYREIENIYKSFCHSLGVEV